MIEMTQSELRELVSYDPDTGIFIRLKSGWRKQIGKPVGRKDTYGYIQIKLFGKAYLAHRAAWLYVHGQWPDGEIDHINGDRSDNRISNLRIVSHALNCQNRHKVQSTSVHAKLLGVGYDKRYNRYFSVIQTNGKRKYLGSFDSAKEAHLAYLSAKKELHPHSAIVQTHANDNAIGENYRTLEKSVSNTMTQNSRRMK